MPVLNTNVVNLQSTPTSGVCTATASLLSVIGGLGSLPPQTALVLNCSQETTRTPKQMSQVCDLTINQIGVSAAARHGLSPIATFAKSRCDKAKAGANLRSWSQTRALHR